MNRRTFVLASLALPGCAAVDDYLKSLPARPPDAPAIMSPDFMVDAMLDLAEVRAGDVLYDLGCGDGRIVVEAARRGARGVGVDLDPREIKKAIERAQAAQVADRTRFVLADIFGTSIGDATVVTLYLSEAANIKLIPKLRRELRPGTRVVAPEFGMGNDWPPETRLVVGGRYLYRWIV